MFHKAYRSFQKGVDEYYDTHPGARKTDGELIVSLKRIFGLATNNAARNYIKGKSAMTEYQEGRVRALFKRYGIPHPFDDEN